MAVTGKNILTEEDFPQHVRSAELTAKPAESIDPMGLEVSEQFFSKGLSLDVELESHEKCILLGALKRANGVQKRAAEILGINYRSLRHRLEKYELLNSKSESIENPVDDVQ